MIEQGLFKRHSIGKDGFNWFIAQIAPEDTWKNNVPGVPDIDNTHELGFGERYRIRMIGHQTHDPEQVPDETLHWAYVSYPVTAGSGLRGSSMNANLTQGCFVKGFFLDGEDGQTPIIESVIGNNDYQAILKNLGDTDPRFLPFSGYLEDETRATHDIKKEPSPGDVIRQVMLEQAADPSLVNEFAIESATATNNISSFLDWGMREWGTISEPLDQPEDCQPVPMGRIQKQIQNTIAEIERIQRSLNDYRYALAGLNAQAQQQIQYLTSKATRLIASGIKWVTTLIEQTTIDVVNEAMKPLYFLVFPNQRPELKKGVEKVNDTIACAFQKIIGQLVGMVGDFLSDALDKAVNIGGAGGGAGGGGGAVTGMLGNVIGQITGGIEGTISDALGSISGIAGEVGGVVGQVGGFLKQILSFLSCDTEQACYTVNDWSMWGGPGQLENVDFDKLKSGSKNTAQRTRSNNSSNESGEFEFDVNFENSLQLAVEVNGQSAPGSIVDNTVLYSQFLTTTPVQSRAFIAGTPTQTLASSVSSFVVVEDENGEFVTTPVSQVGGGN